MIFTIRDSRVDKMTVFQSLFFMIVKSGLFATFIVFVCLFGSWLQTGYAYTATGWHWYNESQTKKIKKEGVKKIEKIKNVGAQQEVGYPYSQQMIELQKATKEALNQAILNPTEESLKNYIILQNYITDQASKFSIKWQKALLEYPDLDYQINHPTQNSAQSILYTIEKQKEDQAIRDLSKDSGLFFFYRGGQLLDQALAQTIISFAEENHISLLPITVDGTILPDLQNSRIDQGQAEAMGIAYFPALVLVNPFAKKYIPINYGFITQDELRKRFLQVADNFED